MCCCCKTGQTLQMQRDGCCLYRWGWVVHTGKWVLVAFGTRNRLIWRKLRIGRGTCWIDHRWAGTLCLCDESSQLWSPAMGHQGHLREALAVLMESCALCIWCTCRHSQQCQHWCQASILLLSLGLASSPSPDGLHEGLQGCSQGFLEECILGFPLGEYQPLWTAHPRCPRSVGQSLGPVWDGQVTPWGWGSILCCRQGHIWWYLRLHPALMQTIGHVGCSGGWG